VTLQRSRRRSVLTGIPLLFWAVFLASASVTQANPVTYRFVDYPADQADAGGLGIWHVSGAIVTDGTLGSLTSGNHITGGYMTVSGPYGQDTFSGGSIVTQAMDVYATTSALWEPSGGSVQFSGFDASGYEGDLYYENGLNGSIPQYMGQSNVLPGGVAWVSIDPSDLSPSGQGGAWLIASTQAVPEPTVLSLFGTALPGLAGFLFARRRRGGKK